MGTDAGFTIVVFVDSVPGPNGVRSYYRLLSDWCERTQRARVVVVCSGGDSWDEPGPGSVVTVRPSLRIPHPFYRDLVLGYYRQARLRRILSAIEGPRVVHIASPGPLGVAGAWLAHRLGLPCVGFYHANTRECAELYGAKKLGTLGGWLGTNLAGWCERLAYGGCRSVLAASESAAKAVREFYDGHVEVIPIPLDVDRFQAAPIRSGSFRERYNADGKVLAIVVGRIAMEKNLDLVGRYLLADRRINTVFVGDGPYRSALETRWNATVTGFLRGDDLVDAYQQADVYIQLSDMETFGMTLAEAMAAGLPPIVLRSRGFVESLTVESGVDVIERSELETLPERCLALTRDAARYRDASYRARNFVASLSVERVLPRLCEFHRVHAS